MPQKYQTAIEWLLINGAVIGGSFIALAVSILQSKQRGKISWTEALLCALIALGVNSALDFVHLPSFLSLFIGVFIGSAGSQWVRRNMMRIAEDKLSGQIGELKQKVDAITQTGGEDNAPSN